MLRRPNDLFDFIRFVVRPKRAAPGRVAPLGCVVRCIAAVGDTDAMAQSTLKLLQDSALHGAMSAAAREACLSRWQMGPIVDAWETLYARLLRKQK